MKRGVSSCSFFLSHLQRASGASSYVSRAPAQCGLKAKLISAAASFMPWLPHRPIRPNARRVGYVKGNKCLSFAGGFFFSFRIKKNSYQVYYNFVASRSRHRVFRSNPPTDGVATVSDDANSIGMEEEHAIDWLKNASGLRRCGGVTLDFIFKWKQESSDACQIT